jgi:hypothetical protein
MKLHSIFVFFLICLIKFCVFAGGFCPATPPALGPAIPPAAIAYKCCDQLKISTTSNDC